MNRRFAGAALFLVVAVAVVWVAGCARSMTTGPSGPLPPPQSAQSVEATATSEMPVTVEPATATVESVTPQPATPTATRPPEVATAVPMPAQAITTPATGGQTTYTVKPGDRLFSIGRQFNVNPYAIARANRIGSPYTIRPGQVLVIPTSGTPGPSPSTYTVKPGDTVYSIARKFNKSASAIITANNLTNSGLIFPGQVLKIP